MSDENIKNARKLDEIYEEALDCLGLEQVSISIQEHLDFLLEHRESNRGVLAIITTLIFKKIISPEQDIRFHQRGMSEKGFSARVLDTKVVTPFLKKQGFPHMASGSGALTRSLEQAVPYDMNYPGQISPKELKNAFLLAIKAIEAKECCPKEALIFILKGLISYRDRDTSMRLIRPIGKPIKDIVSVVDKHFSSSRSNASRLPVLAIYAVYRQLVKELKRYEGCELCDLQSHNSADVRTGFLGDIQINDSEGNPFEAIEIKHGIGLTPELVDSCFEKFKKTTIKTYYLLSTNENIEDMRVIGDRVMEIQRNHGCQMIVNGIQTTLKYYLRLLSDTDKFVSGYADLIEQECDYKTKMEWGNIWTNSQ